MDKCIYLYNAKEKLTYKSREHVFPAGLGGITKLSNGIVSDQANNIFSKYELIGIRKSLLTGNRIRHGPGRRGNQKVKKEKKPVIRMLKKEASNGENLIGYIFAGDAYIIPQLSCSQNNISQRIDANYFCDDFDVDNLSEYQLDFKKK